MDQAATVTSVTNILDLYVLGGALRVLPVGWLGLWHVVLR